jgi:prepilin-type N-terminal cleavage/methylation domain-containing protein
MTPRSPTQRAFTLVELLVVMAVVALLLGLLLPAMSAARVRAATIESLSNLRTLGQTTHVFANDHDLNMPRSTHSFFAHLESGAEPWYRSYYTILAERSYEGPDAHFHSVVDRYFRNPLDPRESGTDQSPFAPEYNGSYGFNVYFELAEGETPDGRTWRRLTRTPRASETVVFAEVSEGRSSAMAARDHVMAHFWLGGAAPPGSEIAVDRNRPGCGYVFLDGHAANLEFAETFNEPAGIDRWNPSGM